MGNIDYDLNDYHGTAYSHVLLLLYPAHDGNRALVSTWANVGAGEPEAAFHNRAAVLCGLPTNVCADSLQGWLSDVAEGALEEIGHGYLGEELVNGSYKGNWCLDAISKGPELSRLILEAINNHDIQSFWSAGGWFVEAPSVALGEHYEALVDWAEACVDEGRDEGVRLDKDDVLNVLRGYLVHRLEEIEGCDSDELDESDLVDLETCRRLLGGK